MPSFSNCRIVVTCDDGRPVHEDRSAQVRIDEDFLIVHYWDDEGPVVFVAERPRGRVFELKCRSRPRQARLELSASGDRLSGSWREDDHEGTLVVEIPT